VEVCREKEQRFTSPLSAAIDQPRGPTTWRAGAISRPRGRCSGVATRPAPEGATSQLSGVVFDAGGSAVADAIVSLVSKRAAQNSKPLTVLTDREGRFTFPAIPAAEYSVQVVKRGFRTTTYRDESGAAWLTVRTGHKQVTRVHSG